MENLRELIHAKFTHMGAKIEAQGTLFEEKLAHAQDHMEDKLDEIIKHQKTANGHVANLQEESERCKEYRVKASVTPLWKKIPLYVVIPVIFTIIGLNVRAFIDLEDVKKNKVEKETYIESQSQLILLVEAKTRAQESLAKTNKQDIEHINQYLQEIKTAQDQIDELIYEKFRTRGTNERLPEF